MLSFFSLFFKNKKIFIFIFLFLILSCIIVPQMADASSNRSFWSRWNPYNPEFYLDNEGQLNATGSFVNNAVDALEEGGKVLFLAIVMGACTITLLFTNALAGLASSLFLWVLSIQEGISFTRITGPDYNPAVAAAWPMVRDLANMFVVLGFVVIGIATILRIREYEAKKILIKLIVVALLINFSLLICGIFIDGSNIVIKSFGDQSGSFMAKTWGRAIFGNIENIWNNFDTKQMGKSVGLAVGTTFGEMVRFIVYMLYFFLFLFRYFALWILVILSPLAFVSYVFPFSKKFFDMWWSNFLGWCIVGIPGMFFIWLADTISSDLNNMITSTQSGPDTPGGVGNFMVFLIPGFFMILGFMLSLQISAMGAGAATGAFKWAGGMALGAGAGLSKLGAKGAFAGADKATGGKLSSGAQKISGGVGRGLERLGLRKQGTTAVNEGARIAEEKKRVEAQLNSGNVADREAAFKAARTGRGVKGAGAFAAVTSTGKLNDAFKDSAGKIDTDAMERRTKFTEQFGGGENLRKEALKQNYELAGLDEKRVNQQLTNMGVVNPAMATATQLSDAKESVRIEQLKENLPNMSGSDIRKNISHDDLFYNYDLVKDGMTPNMIKHFRTATPDKIAAIQGHVGVVGAAGTLADDLNKAIVAGNKPEAARLQKIITSINNLTP
jgi:hypothetical protein